MAENRQNWRKFKEILGFAPARKQGLVIIGSGKKILAGTTTHSCQELPRKDFQHQNYINEHVENTWEHLCHEYVASGLTYIDRDELFSELASVVNLQQGKISSNIYYQQLQLLRESLKLHRGDKTKLAVHVGDKPVENFWPREHFFLGIFRSMFAELLPERKILLLSIIEPNNSLQSIVLEFQGATLKTFSEPDWYNIEWLSKDLDYFHPDTAKRFILWCENHYILPTYGVFLTRKTWDECQKIQVEQGDKAAWKHLLQIKKQRDVDVEVYVEPEPWPVKAALHWNSMK